MRLKEVFTVMCPPPNVVQTQTLSRLYQNGVDHHHSPCHQVVRVSFEYIFSAPNTHKRKPTSTQGSGGRKQMPKDRTSTSTSAHPTVSTNNPIFDFIHRNESLEMKVRQTPTHTPQHPKHRTHDRLQPPPLPTTGTTPCKRCITQRVWGLRAIAPLIIWLQKRNKRYCHSDWVNQYSNGERTVVVTQHGEVVSKENVHQTHDYSCRGGFHNVYLRCSVKHATHPHPDDDAEIWSSLVHKETDTVLCKTYQQRCYVWDAFTTILLQTVDGKQFNVCIEHCNPQRDVRATAEFQTLISIVAYHLSQHTCHQLKV